MGLAAVKTNGIDRGFHTLEDEIRNHNDDYEHRRNPLQNEVEYREYLSIDSAGIGNLVPYLATFERKAYEQGGNQGKQGHHHIRD